jgi:PAS domain S-box-containing protein
MTVSKQSVVVMTGSSAPAPAVDHGLHSVQFYRTERSIVKEAVEFIGRAVLAGDSAVVLATDAHREAIARELEARSLDVFKLREEGRFISRDAADTLAEFMVHGMPDEPRFKEVIGGISAKGAAKPGSRQVAVFGEMVAVLWAEGNYEAAIRLEEFWNHLSKTHAFQLRCAYPISGFRTDEEGKLFARLCEQHTSVIPEDGRETATSDDEHRRMIAKLQQRAQVLEHKKVLRESEQRFRLLVEAVQDYAIFMLDPEGNVTSWNIGAERIKGYKASEIIGQHFSRFYPEEDVRAGKPARELEVARREGRVEDEGWRVRKDGSEFWALVVITALRDQSGQIVGFAKVTRDFTERMKAQQQLQESQRRLRESEESLRQLSLRLLRAQDEERRRIARDLHDTLGQILTVLKMKLDSLSSTVVAANSDDAKQLALAGQLTEEAVKEVRTISYLLYPPMLEELGLKSAIAWYLDGFAQRSGIKTSFTAASGFPRLAGDVELALFRVLQESLTNVHRHSGSAVADVELSLNDETAVLQVRDHGEGMRNGDLEQSLQDWTGAFGVGLRGMSERLREVGGKIELKSTPHGTTVRATVPAGEKDRREIL